MTKYLIIFSAIAFTLLLGWTCLKAQPQQTGELNFDKYRIIYQQNIFSKSRRSPREDDNPRPQIRRSVVLSLYVLKGIAVNQQQKNAFIEEMISGQTIKAQIGSELLNGKIADIRYDHVIFTENGTEKQIRIGQEFGKTETVTVSQAPEGPEGEETPAETKEPEAKTDDQSTTSEEDLLKKMLERRKAELGN